MEPNYNRFKKLREFLLGEVGKFHSLLVETIRNYGKAKIKSGFLAPNLVEKKAVNENNFSFPFFLLFRRTVTIQKMHFMPGLEKKEIRHARIS